MNFVKKTVLITGASRGIGEAIAREFAGAEYNVVINYLNSSEKAETLAQELGGIAFCADVSDYKQVENMIVAVHDNFGGIDVLVNNAGVALPQKLLADTTEAEWDRLFDINVKGAFNCTKAVMDGMVQKHSGSIINVSSVWGVTGGSCEVAYSASKAAIIGFTKALAKELGPAGIRVNCVAPGVIDTDMNAHLSREDMSVLCEETPLGFIGEPSDIAKIVLFLASDGAKFITGQVITADGGLTV